MRGTIINSEKLCKIIMRFLAPSLARRYVLIPSTVFESCKSAGRWTSGLSASLLTWRRGRVGVRRTGRDLWLLASGRPRAPLSHSPEAAPEGRAYLPQRLLPGRGLAVAAQRRSVLVRGLGDPVRRFWHLVLVGDWAMSPNKTKKTTMTTHNNKKNPIITL